MNRLLACCLILVALGNNLSHAFDTESLNPYFDPSDQPISVNDSIDTITLAAYHLISKNLDSALYLSEWALAKSNDNSYRFGQAESHSRLGGIYHQQEKYSLAIIHHRRAQILRAEMMAKDASERNITRYMGSLNNLSTAYVNEGKVDSALLFLAEGLSILQAHPELPENRKIQYNRSIRHNYGNAYQEAGKRDSALKYFYKSLAYGYPEDLHPFYTQKTSRAIATTYLGFLPNTAYRYIDSMIQVFPEDTAYIASLWELKANWFIAKGLNDSARTYYYKSLPMRIQQGNLVAVGLIKYNLALSFLHEQNFDQASTHFKEAISYYQNQNQERRLAECYASLGAMARDQGQLDTALANFRKAYQLAERKAYKLEKLKIATKLSNIYFQLNQADSAFKYERLYRQVRDEIKDSEVYAAILKGKNDRKKVLLQEARKRQTYLQIGGIVTFSFLSLLIFLLYKQRELARRDAYHKDQQARINEETVRIQEQERMKERRKIGRDLHDHIAGDLVLIKRKMEDWLTEKDLSINVLESRLTQATDELEKAFEQVRQLSHEMTEGSREKLEIKYLLETIKKRIENDPSTDIAVVLDCVELKKPLKQEIKFQLFSIANEIAENAKKYSEASLLNISFNQNEDGLNLIIEDNGKGFDLKK